ETKTVLSVPSGLNEEKAAHFSLQWGEHYAALSRLAVGQTLMVNQLVDMEWKFGVTVGTSEIQKVGNIFLQLKLVVRKGNSTENVFMDVYVSLSRAEESPQFSLLAVDDVILLIHMTLKEEPPSSIIRLKQSSVYIHASLADSVYHYV
ncbi:hypothetical protein GOODEAATRI_030085, partial [Goodea atripinnis]